MPSIAKLEGKVNSLDEELKAAKKLKGKPKISPSRLNQEEKKSKKSEKRPGSDKRSKKLNFVVDEERIIEPEAELPDGATFNGYREYDVQDLIIKSHNIRFLLAEYVTVEGKTIVGKLQARIPGTLRTHPEVIYSLSTSSVSSAPEFNRRTA